MPIYEFACTKCRVVFNFFSQRINPGRSPVCPKCGNRKMAKQMSRFAMTKGLAEPAAAAPPDTGGPPEPDLSPADEARMMRAMGDLERDMDHFDENNPRHMAHVMKRMKDALPSGTMPKEMDIAIKRLEAGEDPERIEADMGEELGGLFGEGEGGPGGGRGGYSHDPGLYDY